VKPLLGITMGDAAGVGPEIIVKTLCEPEVFRACCPVVIGDRRRLEAADRVLGAQIRFRAVTRAGAASGEPGTIDVMDLANVAADLPFGHVDAGAGRAAYAFVAKAVELALRGEIQAIVTAPLNKQALNLAGCRFPGHTEILAHLSGTKDYAMLLVGGSLRVIHATTHVSIRQACDRIRKERVLRVIQLADGAMRRLGVGDPRIAVAGLNPHAGEGGLLGREEREQIEPAVAAASSMGLCVFGPIPPDTVFHRAAIKKEFDIVVAMYHDQGHIPLKLLDFSGGVNVTVGLPFIRTSVDHGTAFDIAGSGRADNRSLREALLLAARMTSPGQPLNW
jgi:4-phospho-D-threonate 3-dehydrogenase / 4-phospho-D-erythronate 3-dehydrogenase